jgi:uncharacterized protein
VVRWCQSSLSRTSTFDPTLRPYKDPIDAQRREQPVLGTSVGVPNIYRYFLSRRRLSLEGERRRGTRRRSAAKIGRNEPCPCGSGKKFKKCCGAVTVQP